MKIVIIGLGTIGSDILKTLSKDKHTITIIDEDKKVIDSLVDKYDIQGVVGNGASLDIQVEANMKTADMAIVLTKSDELNIFACMVAKKLGVNNTIARVRNPDYRRQVLAMQDELGISMIVNPEKDTASEIFNLINLPEIVEAEHFANNKALLVEIVAEPGCALINESLISVGQKLNTKVLICAVQRGEEVIIPTGHFVIQEGDKICFTADTKDLRDFLAEINIVKSPLKNIMIVGGMAGSTAGGLKVSRIVFALKGSYINVRKTINPRYVPKTKFEGKTIEEKTLNDVFVYITLYAFILLFVVLTLSFDPINGTTSTIVSDAGTYEVTHGFASNFSAAVSCMSNIGPGIEAVGPYASFAGYSIFSKGLLTIVMILGRLEILPVLVLFNKRTWERI